MISLRISNSCKDTFSSFETDDTSSFGVLIGYVDNQVYQVMDLIKLKIPVHSQEIPNFEQFLKGKFDEQDTVETRVSFLVSNIKAMMVGGLSILGLIYKHKFSSFDSKNSLLKDVLDSIQSQLDKLPEVALLLLDSKKNEMDAVLYEYKTRKFSSLNYQYQNLKEKPTLISLSLQTELIIAIPSDKPLKHSEITEKLKESIRQWTTDISHGQIRINGLFFDKSETVESIKNKTQCGDQIKLNIFSQKSIRKVKEGDSKSDNHYLTFRGCFTSYAYSFGKKTSLKDCFLAIIKDLNHSVQSKLTLLMNELDPYMDQQIKANSAFFLPNRIYFECQANSFVYCDYLSDKEKIKDSNDRVGEMICGNLKNIDTFEFDSSKKVREAFEQVKASLLKKGEEPRQRNNKEEKIIKQNSPETSKSESKIPPKEDDTMKYIILIGVFLVLAGVYFVYLRG